MGIVISDASGTSMKLSEAIQGYVMDAHIAVQSPRYIAMKQQRLGYFANWCIAHGAVQLEQVTPNVIRAFIVHLQGIKAHELNPHRPTQDKPLAPLTIKGYRTNVNAFFRWAKNEGYLGGRDVPTKSLPPQRIPQYVIETFTPEQLQAMLDVCQLSTPLGYRDYALLLILIDTGARVSEISGLRLGDVHDHYITVLGKGSKEREIGLSPLAEQAIWRYIHQARATLPHDEHEDHVFLGRAGKPLLRSGVYQALERIGQTAGIQGVRLSPHTFRHTFAVSWLKNGGDIFHLSRILGHTEMQTTQIYLKDFQSREARAEHAQYSPLGNLKLGKKRAKQKGV